MPRWIQIRSPALKLDTLLKKVKASGVSSMEGIGRLTNSINLRRENVMLQKTSRTWILLVTVVSGCAFGSGLSYPPTRKHLVEEESMQGAKKQVHRDQTML